ncbi:MAG: histidine kinase [Casimicrobiaceae bacterium]
MSTAMQPEIVVAYLKAVAASVVRTVIGLVAAIALNLLLIPGLLTDVGPYRAFVVSKLDRMAGWWLLAACVVVALALLLPLACFRYAQWRYKGLDARALLPVQHRELSLPLAADDAFALARRAMQHDPALFDVVADSTALSVDARAIPLHSRSTSFGTRRGADSGDRAAPNGWPARWLKVLDALRMGSPRRRIRIAVSGIDGGGAATISITAQLQTLLPAVDICGRNRRHVDALANTITALVQPLMAQRREQEQRAQLERRLLETRLTVLRAQIEPHFLYNTLANVQYLLRSDPPAAARMVGALIDYLRQALPKMRDATSTLGEETALVRAYLDILCIRMGKRLATSIDVPPALSSHPFPPMLLLSLAENAIKHGLEPKLGGGTITITATSGVRKLRVRVADDGAGFAGDAGNGIGLCNARETLMSLYGASGTLTVEPADAGGVVATIEIPLQTVPVDKALHVPSDSARVA